MYPEGGVGELGCELGNGSLCKCKDLRFRTRKRNFACFYGPLYDVELNPNWGLEAGGGGVKIGVSLLELQSSHRSRRGGKVTFLRIPKNPGDVALLQPLLDIESRKGTLIG